MNATLDRIELILERATPPKPCETADLMVSKNAPPVSQQAWCPHYNEEWAAFFAAHDRKKSNPSDGVEPESLPRVWNTPHG